MKPLVSVVMPAYNAEKYISKAIESILNQTYTNFELLIVEDCSTDNTINEIHKFLDKRIRIFENDKNCGIAYSSNRAIKESNGKYIALMDDDDIALPERLALTVDYLENNPNISIVGGGGLMIDSLGNVFGAYPIPRHNPDIIKSVLLFENWMINDTVLFKRDLVYKHDIWYRDGYCGMQDFQFYMEASKVVKISNIPNNLVCYRFHSDSETFVQTNYNMEKKAACFAKIQRESLNKSGFRLDENELNTINDLLSELHKKSYTRDELNHLYAVLLKIVQQSIDMHYQGIDELRWVCRKMLCSRLQKSDIL